APGGGKSIEDLQISAETIRACGAGATDAWSAGTHQHHTDVAAAFRLLLLSIYISAASLLFDQPIVPGLVAAVLAAGVATVALAIPPGEAGHLQRIFRPAAAVLAVPAAWMVIQILPLNFVGLAHPIWASAAEALGRPIGGGISIDPGTTLFALGRYLSAVAAVLVAAAVAVDRQRANVLLIALAGAGSLIGVLALVHDLTTGAFLHHLDHLPAGHAMLAGPALGAVLAAAMAIQQFELDVSGRGKHRATGTKDIIGRVASLAALGVCLIALISSRRSEAIFAAACGLATVGAVAA